MEHHASAFWPGWCSGHRSLQPPEFLCADAQRSRSTAIRPFGTLRRAVAAERGPVRTHEASSRSDQHRFQMIVTRIAEAGRNRECGHALGAAMPLTSLRTLRGRQGGALALHARADPRGPRRREGRRARRTHRPASPPIVSRRATFRVRRKLCIDAQAARSRCWCGWNASAGRGGAVGSRTQQPPSREPSPRAQVGAASSHPSRTTSILPRAHTTAASKMGLPRQ